MQKSNRMKVRPAIVMALVLLAVAVAPATASKARVAKATYDFDTGKPGPSGWFGDDYGIFFGEAVALKTKSTDRTVEMLVADESAQAVSAAMWQEGAPAMVFCNQMASMPITGGQPVYVQVIIDVTPAPANGCATPEVPTTGTITATFNAMKKGGGHHHH